MKTQTFSNHTRVHPLYHYFAVPVSLFLVPAAIVNLVLDFSTGSVILVAAMIMLHLAIFLTRDYAKKNQDRIIRIELRLRFFELTSERLEPHEANFTTGQLLALRFAGDEEFVRLIKDPKTKSKNPVSIKSEIVHWTPDLMRV